MTSTSGPLDRLDAVVRAVAADRRAVLDTVAAVESAASALDATDAVCLTGRGVAARTEHRKAAPLAARAAARMRVLTGALAAYRASLVSLAAASVAVSGAPRAALARAVTTGRQEIAAVTAFGKAVAGVWPQFVELDSLESTWITRAVTPWYRSEKEARDAYIVLVEDQRPALNAARGRLGEAVTALQGRVAAQTRALADADRALTGTRDAG